MKTAKDKKAKKKKVILISLGTAAAGVLGYFGWQWWKEKKAKKEDEQEESTASFTIPSAPQQRSFLPSSTVRNDEFPLKKGSKGSRVKALQDALIAKNGKSILPKYGADGDFGSETITALKKLNLPEEIDENTFNVLTKGSGINPQSLAQTLYNYATSKNITQVIATLKGMKNADDYSSVSEIFKNNYRVGGVRKTLVNGLLDSFPDDKHKQQIRLEFTRMGLKYDGSMWSLSGLDGFSIITTQPTVVWKNPKYGIKVPANMVLGTEVTQSEDYTVFENNNEKFLVKTQSIKYL